MTSEKFLFPATLPNGQTADFWQRMSELPPEWQNRLLPLVLAQPYTRRSLPTHHKQLGKGSFQILVHPLPHGR
ncbi:hypothetical protein CI109_106932 [Kwoniella shandongensis]|uniref:Uncharacterized protein n=1 Tax=Kwoniella shandongensis TaxID=1734106 RepID=A0AAJ8LPR5_9TREE